MQSLSENDFAATKKSVSEAVANLDTLSRRLIPKLESFVVLAPAVASRGAKAKSNYVFANADVFRISEVRKISGYPAVSIIAYKPVNRCYFIFCCRFNLIELKKILLRFTNTTLWFSGGHRIRRDRRLFGHVQQSKLQTSVNRFGSERPGRSHQTATEPYSRVVLEVQRSELRRFGCRYSTVVENCQDFR